MDPAERARLMKEGQAAFNRGEFFDAHEFWEEVWDQIDPPERLWVQGLIQVATGLHKLERVQLASSRSLLAKGLAKLADAPALLDGLDLAGLRAQAEGVADSLARGERPDPRALRLADA